MENTTEHNQLLNTLEALNTAADGAFTVYALSQHASLRAGLLAAFRLVPELHEVELALDGDDYLNPHRPIRVRMQFTGLDNGVDLSEYMQNYVNEEELGEVAAATKQAAFILSAAGWDRLGAWEHDTVLLGVEFYDRESPSFGMPKYCIED